MVILLESFKNKNTQACLRHTNESQQFTQFDSPFGSCPQEAPGENLSALFLPNSEFP